MKGQLIRDLTLSNPWLSNPHAPFYKKDHFIKREQMELLLSPEWDDLWLLLIGPRQAGKTTLAKHVCAEIIKSKRFNELLYLNCDFASIREWLQSPTFIADAQEYFHLTSPIFFIDEVQRIKNPGLLLKAVADLALPIKMIASGSSQLEMRSQVKEHLTGRNFASLILPLSFSEWSDLANIEEVLLYGTYPKIIKSNKKKLHLSRLYNDYIDKDIIEILKLQQPETFQKLLILLAHCSGQLLNYTKLASDCQIKTHLIKNYLSILEQTYIIATITPFVQNKRVELTSNPIVYFIDNGFRNYALRNFSDSALRSDLGLLIQNMIFQEIYKYIAQNFLDYPIHYWRTKSGAEVDFVIYKNDTAFLPIEAKYRNITSYKMSRSFHSFIDAYQPNNAVIITKDFVGNQKIDQTHVHYIPLERLDLLFPFIQNL